MQHYVNSVTFHYILKKLCVYLGNLAYNFNFLFIGLLLNSSYIQLLVDITPCTYVKDIYKEFVAYNTKNSPVATYSQSEDVKSSKSIFKASISFCSFSSTYAQFLLIYSNRLKFSLFSIVSITSTPYILHVYIKADSPFINFIQPKA